MAGLLGEKIEMTQVFSEDGRKIIPVTIVKAGPCVVTQIKTESKEGYNAVQVGYGNRNLRHTNLPSRGHLIGVVRKSDDSEKKESEKAKTEKKVKKMFNEKSKKDRKLEFPRYLAEFRVKDPSKYKVGDIVKCSDILRQGETVDVTGISKGKGFQGVVKRHGFKGGPAGHGSMLHRAPGAIGMCATPSKVFKGKKMPGRMGGVRKTVQSLEVVKIIPESDIVLLKGSMPGPKGGIVKIKESVKGKKKADSQKT